MVTRRMSKVHDTAFAYNHATTGIELLSLFPDLFLLILFTFYLAWFNRTCFLHRTISIQLA